MVAEEVLTNQALLVLEDLVVEEQTEMVEDQETLLQLVHHKEIKADHQHQDHLLEEVVEVQVLQDLLNLALVHQHQVLQVEQEYQLLLIQQVVRLAPDHQEIIQVVGHLVQDQELLLLQVVSVVAVMVVVVMGQELQESLILAAVVVMVDQVEQVMKHLEDLADQV